jgi:hypothetical protein
MKSQLSALWIFVKLNYLYCDVAGLMDRSLLSQYLAGWVNELDVSPGFLLAPGILIEIPITMVLLFTILNYRANRIANIVAGSVMTIVQVAMLFVGSPRSYYLFFSIIEIACTAFIAWTAWKWSESTLQQVEMPEQKKVDVP